MSSDFVLIGGILAVHTEVLISEGVTSHWTLNSKKESEEEINY